MAPYLCEVCTLACALCRRCRHSGDRAPWWPERLGCPDSLDVQDIPPHRRLPTPRARPLPNLQSDTASGGKICSYAQGYVLIERGKADGTGGGRHRRPTNGDER